MKKIYLSVSVLVFTILAIWFSSCQSPYESKLQGKWKMINVDDISSPYTEYWTFEEQGGRFILFMDTVHGMRKSFTNDTARYYINARLRKTFIHIEDCKISYYDGDWQIIHLTSSAMMIVRNSPMSFTDVQATGGTDLSQKGGLMFREFTKE